MRLGCDGEGDPPWDQARVSTSTVIVVATATAL
jgi:hypothetical protein